MSKRVLYVTGEIAPFSETTATATLMRQLAEALAESEDRDYEARVIMPRYGVVSERRNRLHEVIRLSGAVIPAGAKKDTLKVKVASIPGLRLQVYFMDSPVFLKKKGIWEDKKTGVLFEDNLERALFFARAALSTAEKLNWAAEVVHASGWASALLPVLLKTEGAGKEVFAKSKVIYTPDAAPVETVIKNAEALGLPAELEGVEIREAGCRYADAVAAVGSDRPGATDLSGDDAAERTAALYEELTAVTA